MGGGRKEKKDINVSIEKKAPPCSAVDGLGR